MAIRVVCPACDAAFSVSDELKGKKIRCRECEKPVLVGASRPSKSAQDDDDVAERVQTKPRKAARDDDDVKDRVQTKPRKSAPSRPRNDDEDEDKRRPGRKGGRYDADDEEDEDRRTLRKQKKSSALPWILAAVGGGVVLLGGVIGLVIYLNREPEKQTANLGQPDPPNIKGPGGPPGGMGGGKGGPPGGMGGPKGRGRPKDGNVDIGDVLQAEQIKNLQRAQDLAKALDPEIVKKIQACTVQFEVMDSEKNPTYMAHGSGFLAVEPGLVLTNAHVVSMKEPGTEEPEVIKVFIHRGTPEQKEYKGKVLGVDRRVDLAVVRLTDTTGLPDPLTVLKSGDLKPTTVIYICGFPFVGGRAVSNQVSVLQGSVMSLHTTPSGILDKVVLNSDMQHGNSGGPIVTEKGDVVGVSVAGFEMTRINFAVPAEYVHVIVNGQIAHERVGQCYRSQARVSVPMTFDLINPLDHVQKVEVEVWAGDDTKDYKPPASVDAAPAPRPGDSKRETFDFALRKDKTSGAEKATGSMMLPVLPENLPQGKAFWWQPVLTFTDKGKTFKQWLSGAKYVPEEPAERRSLKLVHKNNPSTRKVTLSIKHKLRAHTLKGEEKELNAEFICDMTEKMLAADSQGKSVLNITVERAAKSINIPEEFLPEEKKAPELDPEEQRALDNANFLELMLLLNNRGGIEKAAYTAKGAPADVRSHVEELGHEILDALQSVYIQLPNRTVDHLEPWKAEKPVPIPIVLPFGSASAPMKVEYNYLGLMSQDGHEEGLVEVTGNFRSKGGRILQVGGRLEGRASVDVEAGIVKLARARVRTETQIRGHQLPPEMSGTMEILLKRELVK
jgi:S1-C subfamily serine protease